MKTNVIPFPVLKSQQDERDDFPFMIEDFLAAECRAIERLGGVHPRDLAQGDEDAYKIASRSLRKEFLRLNTQDIYS